MVLGRACVALLSLGLVLGARVQVTPQTSARKKPIAASKKAPAGVVRRAPAARPFNSRKASSKKGGAKLAHGKARGRVTVTSVRAPVAISHASPPEVYAPGAVPVEGREAAITRITESL